MTETATNPTPKGFARVCCECGDVFRAKRQEGLFCSNPCRRDFNNRRAMRGAELYDLFMALRYERALGKTMGLWAIICRMAQLWREEDQRERDGRNSWQRPKAVMDRRPYLKAHSTVIRIGAGAGK